MYDDLFQETNSLRQNNADLKEFGKKVIKVADEGDHYARKLLQIEAKEFFRTRKRR